MSDLDKFTSELKARLNQLPHLACVAFAARCARRVQPIYLEAWPDLTDEDSKKVEKAVLLAERYANAKDVDEGNAETVGLAVNSIAEDNFKFSSAGYCAAFAAALAAMTLPSATARPVDAEKLQEAVVYVVRRAVMAAAGVDVDAIPDIKADLSLLEQLSVEENWTHKSSVPPELFGPFWPNGAPEGWPIETCEDDQLVLEIELPEHANEEEINEHVLALTRGMDGLQRSYGGNGLKIAGIEVLKEVGVRSGGAL